MVFPSIYFIKRTCIPSRLLQLWISSLPRYFLTQSFFTKEKSSFLQTFSLVSWVRDSWELALMVKSEAKRALSMAALSSAPTVAGSPSHSVAATHFPFCFWRTWRTFLYSLTSLARFNFKLALASSWPICTLWPHSYVHPCFHLTCISCLCLSFDRGSLFSHAGVLLLLPNFSLIGMHHF